MRINHFNKYKPNLLSVAITATCLCVPSVSMAEEDMDEAGFTLEEIVVTAQKRESSLQDTPISVTAVTGQLLNEMGIADITGIANVAPNISFSTTGTVSGSSSAAVVYIRGIGQNDYVPVVDPGVGIYVDEVYMGRTVGSVLDLMDIKSVEVVRGPQGTLFGRNSIGGAISISTNDPTGELGGKIRVIGGEDSRGEAFATFDLPVSDKVAANINLMRRKQEGTVERVLVPGSDKLGNVNSSGARIKLNWEASENLGFQLIADHVREREESAAEVNEFIRDLAPGNAGGLPGAWNGLGGFAAFIADLALDLDNDGQPDVFPNFSTPGQGCIADDTTSGTNCYNNSLNMGPFKTRETSLSQNDIDSWGISLAITYRFSDDLSAKLILAYRDLEAYFARQVDGTEFDIFENRDEYLADQFSVDLRFNGNSDKLDWVAGAFYFEETADNQLDFSGVLEGSLYPVHFGGLVDNSNYAVYGEGTFHFTEKLHLTAGVRYTDEEKTAKPNAFGYPGCDIELLPTSPSESCDSQYSAFQEGGTLFRDRRTDNTTSYLIDPVWNSTEFSEVTWRLSLAYDVSQATFVYGSVSTGFKSGGFEWRVTNTEFASNPDFQQSNGSEGLPIFDPETVTTYEIGLKTEIGQTVRLNSSVFYSEFTDMIVAANAGGIATFQTNAAEATIQGVETELTWIPTDAVLINAAIGYIDAQYDKTSEQAQAAGIDTDDKFVLTPEWSGSLGISYRIDLSNGASLTPRIDGTYKSEMEFEANNTQYTRENGYTAWNATLRYAAPGEKWNVTVGVENLTDELYKVGGDANSVIGYENVIYARPRNWYIAAELEF